MAKIIITADLHFFPRNQSPISQAAENIAAEEPDYLVLAGDIGETSIDIHYFQHCIEIFTALGLKVGIIAGNHDLYVNPYEKHDSLWLWKQLPKFTEDAGAEWLENKIKYINSTAIVASYLHYNYSSAEPNLALPDDWYATNKKYIIRDGDLVRGIGSDQEFSEQLGSAFIERLEKANQNQKCKNIIVVTHVPAIEANITRKPADISWSKATAYFGNLTYEKDILECPKVTHIVSGHSHVGRRNEIKNKIAINLDSDYGNPKYCTIQCP